MKTDLLLKPRNIIIRMPNWLGDAIMASAVIEDLRQKFPLVPITIMIGSALAPLFKYDNRINEVFAFSRPKGSIFLRRKAGKNIIETLRRGKYDLGILLTHSFSSAWWFFRGRIKCRIGYKNDLRSLFLSKALPFPKNKEDLHLVDTYKKLLEPLGIKTSHSLPKLFLSEDEVKDAKNFLLKQGFKEGMTLIGVNSTAAFGPAKCWPQEKFKELASLLNQNEHFFILYFGEQKSHLYIHEIIEGLSYRSCNIAGLTDLRELLALISLCHLMVSNDSGPMHMAAALNVPLIALFGSTNAKVTGPYKKTGVIQKHVECSPCYKRVCPIDFRCMKKISPQEVYEEILRVIQIERV